MHLDINEQIERDCQKLENILKFTSGAGVIIAMDRNSRSTLWHDKIINTRGRTLEEFILSRNLYIMNKKVTAPLFRVVEEPAI